MTICPVPGLSGTPLSPGVESHRVSYSQAARAELGVYTRTSAAAGLHRPIAVQVLRISI